MILNRVLKPIRVKRHISGVLLLDKPAHISSNQALQIAKRIFAARKAGHTGTLDPMATGLLPICFGEATKFSSALLGANKTYDATLRLGYISTTGDAEGEISVASEIEPGDLQLAPQQIEAVLKRFTGTIMQVPPMYSALKHQGKPMYAYAREGLEIERQPREAIIHDLHIEVIEGNDLRILVKCGSGTYIRTLAEDIGKALGCGGAYLTRLRRSIVDNFDLSQAYTLDALEAMPLPQRDCCLLPVDIFMRDLATATLDAAAAASLLQGRVICNYFSQDLLSEGQKIRLYDQAKRFLGLGKITAGGEIAPSRLIGNV
ncbi:tRNA pseudouridine synthase B [Nitrosospira sp. Nsp18]|uniref:tRNA pseudouridine(55) synthase TruB n=1 Tax=Nitrosospira sp. Nsp18 TaxID=1855334 RepID=UPI00088150F8|nr:tRNA pseudouridine(55) synthase TruB [Nitrosospira sp. Nsp18]SDA10195.1 tRNA pseudouridine synthase B [Nitrosospira sp. Nsp18]